MGKGGKGEFEGGAGGRENRLDGVMGGTMGEEEKEEKGGRDGWGLGDEVWGMRFEGGRGKRGEGV